MEKYIYKGENNMAIRKEDEIISTPITWSIKDIGKDSRTDVTVLYVKGEPINIDKFQKTNDNLQQT